jgi:hypothetical protein
MNRILTVLGLGGLLVISGGVAIAQEGDPAIINADGSSGASNAGTNPAVDADGPTIVYGDLDVGPGTNVIGLPPGGTAPDALPPGTSGSITADDGNAATLGPGSASAAPGTVNGGVPGTSLLGPDGTYTVTDAPPSNVSVGEAPAPAPEPVPVAETTEPVVADTAVATDSDLDGDNYADAQELEIGLDPNNIDTDGDGVADGDEGTLYGTDPFTWDTDGDGLSDGVELYDTHTDPLVWNADGGGETVAATELVATEGATSGDGDADRLADADEAAVGTDPANPDTDGDGYYDGDEANLGSDYFDPASVPIV